MIKKKQGEVTTLNEDNFAALLDGSQHALVEFYAPWCGHCKNLAPEYEILGELYKEGDGVIIGAVDATENRAIAEAFVFSFSFSFSSLC